jgi:hypothetical protein
MGWKINLEMVDECQRLENNKKSSITTHNILISIFYRSYISSVLK